MNNVIKSFFAGSTEKELHEILNTFWIEYKNVNHNNYHLTVTNLSGTVNLLVMVTVVYGIKNTP